MSGEFKSAREIALAKAEAATGQITTEDRLRWRYLPEGEKLAARILAGEADLEQELKKAASEAVVFLKQGALNLLYSSIILPSAEAEKTKCRRALAAIPELKQERQAAEEVITSIDNLFEHYETHGTKQKAQALEQLKQDYGRKLKHAIEQQLGTSAAGMITDVENLPQFKEEKRRLTAQFDAQYQNLLDDYKKELKEIG